MNQQTIKVTKRDGRLEDLNIDKIKRQVNWACEGLDVSPSEIELNAHIQIYNGIPTTEVHAALINSAADLISPKEPDYQLAAARFLLFNIRKQAYGEFTPPTLKDHLVKMVKSGHYDKDLLEYYSDEELEILNSYINHERDFNIKYAGMVQIATKYLVQSRIDRIPLESPQMAFMLIPMTLFSKYDKLYSKQERLEYIRKFYDHVSDFQISLPSPIMVGARTPTRQYSSCVKIEVEDTLDSIKAGSNAIIDYVSQRAGIGINMGAVRAQGSPVRNGEVEHTGVIPFYKLIEASVKCCSQGKLCCPA